MPSYPLTSSTWGAEEKEAVQRVMGSGYTTMGPEVQAFEEEFASFFGGRRAVMVNSGSSANLLACAALLYHPDSLLRPGDEVITSAVSWGTTYFPLHQLGLKIRLVDVDPDTLNMDLTQLASALTERTRAVLAVNLLGNPNDFTELQAFCQAHELLLIEDNCESMGALFQGRSCGSFGICGTFSSFFSHHICTVEGGVVLTDDPLLHQTLLSLRAHGWTRGLDPQSPVFREAPLLFNQSYTFILPGYNMRPNEIFGALGRCQLRKLPKFVHMRRQNAQAFQKLIGSIPHIRLQQECGESSWFGFSLLLEGPLLGKRELITSELAKRQIDCRPIVAGNIARHPVWSIINDDNTNGTPLPQADHIHDNGFFVGNSHEDLSESIHWLYESLADITEKLEG